MVKGFGKRSESALDKRLAATTTTEEKKPTKKAGAANKVVTPQKKQKTEKELFACRIDGKTVEEWRVFSALKGEALGDITGKALAEYIKRHPLTEEEKRLVNKLS